MPAGKTYENIGQTQTLTSSTNTITFSNISQDYTDLVIVGNLILNTTGNAVSFRANGLNTSADYDFSWWSRGSGGSYGGTNNSTSYGVTNWYTTPGTTVGHVFVADLINYTGTHHYKTLVSRSSSIASNSTYPGNEITVSTIYTTSAITSLSFSPNFGGSEVFTSGTSITLYGIKRA